MQEKLVIVGAGSAMFTQGIVRDWLRREQSPGSELVLVDTNAEILDATTQLARWAVERAGSPLKVTSTSDRRAAFPGATTVVCTIGVGGRRAWEQDVLVPRSYGIFQPVGDSVMPGGISRALRMIPEVLAIARDVESICPTSRFFNYANPMTSLVYALSKHTAVKVVGLCSGLRETLRYLAEFAQVPFEALTARWAGINHLTWILDVEVDGASIWPRVRERLAGSPAQPSDRTGHMFWDENWKPCPAACDDAPFSWELFDQFGAFPAPMDRHVVEFFPERFRDGRYYGKTLGEDAYSFAACIAYGDTIFQRTMNFAERLRSSPPSANGQADSLEGEPSQLMAILEDMHRDRRRWYSVNVPNQGAIDGLPHDCILELPAAAASSGFWVPRVPVLPAPIVSILMRKLAAVEATVEAAITGNRALVAEAMIIDGGVADHSTAIRLTNELIKAQKAYLPQFF